MLSPELYNKIDEKYRDEYKNTFNIDPNDISLVMLTRKEKIRKYARNLLFWYIRKPTSDNMTHVIENPNKISSGIILTRDLLCSSGMEHVINRIKEQNLTNDIIEYLNIPDLAFVFIKKPDIDSITQLKDKYDL